MMNVKREMQMNKLALAALLLGVFTLSPLASADPVDSDSDAEAVASEAAEINEPKPVKTSRAPAAKAKIKEEDEPADDIEEGLVKAQPRGLTLSQLKNISGNIEIKLEGEMLVITGSMPAACAKDRSMSEVKSGDGKHALMIDLPNCRNGISHLSKAQKNQLIMVTSAFPAKKFDDVDGKFCLEHTSSGEAEKIACDFIKINGKELAHESSATKKAKEAKLQLASERSDEQKKQARIVSNITNFCRQGDYDAISLELEAARGFLTDITPILEQLAKSKIKKADSALRRAKNAGELRLAFDNLVAQGGDMEAAEKEFKERRLSMFKDLANSGTTLSKGKLEDAVAEFEADMAELSDPEASTDTKNAAGWMYAEIAGRFRDEEQYDKAEELYTKAMRYANTDGKIAAEKEMAKMFKTAADACLAKNKTKPAKCDALAKKAQKHGEKVVAMLGKKGGDAADEANAMKIELIQTFGVPVVQMKVSGYGIYNPYGGTFAQQKAQMYQAGIQEQMVQMRIQMQMQQAGGVMNGMNGPTGVMPAGATAGSGLFR